MEGAPGGVRVGVGGWRVTSPSDDEMLQIDGPLKLLVSYIVQSLHKKTEDARPPSNNCAKRPRKVPADRTAHSHMPPLMAKPVTSSAEPKSTCRSAFPAQNTWLDSKSHTIVSNSTTNIEVSNRAIPVR